MMGEGNSFNNNNLNAQQKQMKKERNIAEQAKGAQVAFDVLEKIPATSGVGLALKKADKLTGGKVSNTVAKVNQFSPKFAQNNLKMVGKIGSALSLKDSLGKKNVTSPNKNNVLKAANQKNDESDLASTSEKNPTDDIETGEGYTNFGLSKKVKTIALIGTLIGVSSMTFCCLLVAAPQVYLNSITLGNSDATSSEEIDKEIERTPEEDFDNEITDEKLEDATGYDYKITIKRETYANPYILSNWTQKKRKYNEASLSELEDFYGTTLSYNTETAYDFYYKLHDIYVRYSTLYNVELDLPLLMSTLMLESKEMGVVFESNTSDDNYDYKTIKNRSVNHVLDYNYDWSSKGYRISSESSAHDIEILAQNMVSKDSNGKYVIDEEKYKEFLKEFLEKKYFIKGGGLYKDNSNNIDKDGNYVGNISFVDSNFGEVVYYNQGDYSNYYYSSDPSKPQYGSATIQSHGCGPVSLAIILSSILNKQVSPLETTSEVCKAGGCTSSGSYHSTLVTVAQNYGVNTKTTASDQEVIDALATNNSLVIVLMGPGVFTPTGHFIVLTGVNSSGQVSVADPGSRARTEQKWFSFNTVVEQRKTYAPYMIFSR